MTEIIGLYIGIPQDLWPGKPSSAIAKTSVPGPLEVTSLGLVGDGQADLAVHGGVDKALHHYAADHYPRWHAELDRSAFSPGYFGENIASLGLTEETVCIGDVFALGTATVQVSQGRQPCWKLNAHTSEDRMAYLFQKTGRTGWYYRVLSEGVFQVGDRIQLLDRPCPAWSVRKVTTARLSRKVRQTDAAILAELPELAEGWRKAFDRKAQGDLQEDTSARLNG